MRFSSLSPADKMKAGGLIGLIVIVLFFVVHTMLGIVSPRSSTAAQSPADPAAAAQGDPGAVPVAGPTPTGPGAPGIAGGAEAAANPRTAQQVVGLGLSRSVGRDPFEPIPNSKGSVAQAPPMGRQMPDNSAPGIAVNPLPAPGGPASFGPTFPVMPANPAAQPLAEREPDIRVLGYVQGDPTIATFQVDGKVVICRLGEAIYKGYRLLGVEAGGVRIRRKGATVSVRSGEMVHEEKAPGAPGTPRA